VDAPQLSDVYVLAEQRLAPARCERVELDEALDRAIAELAADEAAPRELSYEPTLKIRIGLTPDWAIVMAVSLCIGVFVGALVATRWYLT
jgi:hypothetical protein